MSDISQINSGSQQLPLVETQMKSVSVVKAPNKIQDSNYQQRPPTIDSPPQPIGPKNSHRRFGHEIVPTERPKHIF